MVGIIIIYLYSMIILRLLFVEGVEDFNFFFVRVIIRIRCF